MHFQNAFNNSSFVSSGVVMDSSAAWPLLAASNPTVGMSIAPSSLYNPGMTTSSPLSHSFYSNYTEGNCSLASSTPYHPDLESSPSISGGFSPIPSSPSNCGSMTDSLAPSSSSSPSVDMSLRHMVEQRNATVANLANPRCIEPTTTLEEELKSIKPLLRKPIDTTRMNDRQVLRLEKRRQRNKQAAERCRVKRREKSSQIRQELSLLTHSNEELEQELIRLRSEMQGLQSMICNHQCRIGHSKEELTAMVTDLA